LQADPHGRLKKDNEAYVPDTTRAFSKLFKRIAGRSSPHPTLAVPPPPVTILMSFFHTVADAAPSSPAVQAVANDLLAEDTDLDASDNESTQANAGSMSVLSYSVSRLQQSGKGKGIHRDLASESTITRNYLKSLAVPGPPATPSTPPRSTPWGPSTSAPGPSMPGPSSRASKGKFKQQVGAARSETMRGLRPAMRGRVASVKPLRKSSRQVSSASGGDASVRSHVSIIILCY
jgi:hypothetical protein